MNGILIAFLITLFKSEFTFDDMLDAIESNFGRELTSAEQRWVWENFDPVDLQLV